jgi:hypothetical protein
MSLIRRRDAIATPLTPPQARAILDTRGDRKFRYIFILEIFSGSCTGFDIATKCHTCKESPQLRVSPQNVEDLHLRRQAETESSVSVLYREHGILYLVKRLYRQLEHSRFRKSNEYVSSLSTTTWICKLTTSNCSTSRSCCHLLLICCRNCLWLCCPQTGSDQRTCLPISLYAGRNRSRGPHLLCTRDTFEPYVYGCSRRDERCSSPGWRYT